MAKTIGISKRHCACGCGEYTSLTRHGPRKYVYGHDKKRGPLCAAGLHPRALRCGPCRAARTRAKKYGVSFEVAVNIPDGCAICGDDWLLGIDHDHVSLEFRGWLCRRCNAALGMLDDDISLLEAAIHYLKGEEV